MTLWQRIKQLPAAVFFGIATAVLVIVGLILGKHQERRKLGIRVDSATADRAAGQREAIQEDITAVEARIEAVDEQPEFTNSELIQRWNARKGKK